jgi:hypothetical protein
MKKLRFFSATLVTAVAVAVAVNYALARGQKQVYPARSYRIVSTITHLSRGDDLRTVQVRWVNARGEWKQVVNNLDGKPSGMMFVTHEGSFILDNATGSLQLQGEFHEQGDGYRSAQSLMASDQYVRKDKVLGYVTFVYRALSQNGGGYMETHFAPEFGNIPIKIVAYNASGVAQTVVEAVKIDFADVPDDVLQLPNFPVSLDSLNRDIEDAKSRGSKEEVDGLTAIVRRWQEKTHKQ